MEIQDFTTARLLAQLAYERSWNQLGTFIVERYGWEDAEHFNVVIGSREWLREHNPSFRPDDDDTCILVRKDDGTIEEENPIAIMAKLRAMTEVGVGHPEDEDDDE